MLLEAEREYFGLVNAMCLLLLASWFKCESVGLLVVVHWLVQT